MTKTTFKTHINLAILQLSHQNYVPMSLGYKAREFFTNLTSHDDICPGCTDSVGCN